MAAIISSSLFSLSLSLSSTSPPPLTCFMSASILSRISATEASLGLVRLAVPVPPPIPPVDAARAARRANAACNEGLDKLLARMGPTAPGKQ